MKGNNMGVNSGRDTRHIELPQFGPQGQHRLALSSVLLVGLGGVGSVAAAYLAASGVGRLGLVDFDSVEESNLSRQILYGEPDLDEPKVHTLAAHIRRNRSEMQLDIFQEMADETFFQRHVPDYDLVLEAMDDLQLKLRLGDICRELDKPFICGGAKDFRGMVVALSPQGACLRCFLPDFKHEHEHFGIFSPLPGVVGALEACEALKILAGAGRPLYNIIQYIDVGQGEVGHIEFSRRPDCPGCGKDLKNTR